jgi:hypothetical protein
VTWSKAAVRDGQASCCMSCCAWAACRPSPCSPNPVCPAHLPPPLLTGLAVICVMTLDTSLLAILMTAGWEWHPAAVAAFWLLFTAITGAYLSSNLFKVPKGAWFRQVCPSNRCITLLCCAAAVAVAATDAKCAQVPQFDSGEQRSPAAGLVCTPCPAPPRPAPCLYVLLQPGAGRSPVPDDLSVALGAAEEAAICERQQDTAEGAL